MSTPTIYYPKLSTLIDASAIPGDIKVIEQLVQGGINTLLGNLRYTNYIVEHSPSGDIVFYSLKLLTKEQKLPLGNDLELIFFKGTIANYANFSIAVDWQWQVQRYLNEFNTQGFSYAPEAFLDILLSMADIESEQEVVEEIINVFLSNGTVVYKNAFDEISDTFENLKTDWPSIVTELDALKTQAGIIKTEVINLVDNSNKTLIEIAQNYQQDPAYQNILDAVNLAKTSFEIIKDTADVDIDIYKLFIKAVIKDAGNLDDKFNKLIELFQTWLGNITKKDIEDLLIPQFGFELQNINMALEFPRKWLIPLDETTHEPIPVINSELKFTVGTLKYSTQNGFEFENQSSFDFTYSSIGKTGFTLKVDNLKVDLSKTKNIPEADADGRPVEFTGMYCKDATIGLPKKWFKQKDNQTLAIYGRNLLIGTGGISGNIGLEVIGTGATPTDDELEFVLGKEKAGQTNRKGFTISFKSFDIEWYQNSLVHSEVEGSITIPNFKRYNKTTETSERDDLKINIEALFEQNGDFEITAKPEEGLCICIGEDGKVFFIDILSLSVGKDDDKVYLEVTGDLDFSQNTLLNKFIKTPIAIKKLRIYSDGSFEIEGGSIPIPASISMKLGPVQVNVTNITLGSEDINPKYKFIGFDCGVSSGTGGLDLRGDGIKLYFNADGSDMFIRISGIGIDLTIPGTASDETAALIVKGYLSLKEAEYVGSVSFEMPKAKISGGAAMKMQPKVPAFAIDAFMEMSTAIPLGPTGLGIYGFRGLFGLRYIADLPEGATQDPDKMFDFYTEEKLNPLTNSNKKGLHLGKIVTPEERSDGFKSSRTPISIGAGLSLGTMSDAGRAFSMQAFLFLSIPEMLMISGKANVLGERVKLVGDEPPFFAYMALTKEYISLGMGADYKIPKAEENPGNAGDFLDLHAEAQLAFFFKDPSAWYVHFGTKEEPNRAQLIKKIFNLNAYAYIMLSAAGIQAGAGVRFNKEKKYGPAHIAVNAYADVYGMVSFRKVQVGGGIAFGGSIDVSVFGVGFYIGLDAYLMMTVPKPFIIRGGVQVCVKVKLVFVKFEKCFNVDFKWEFNKSIDTAPIGILAIDYNPASGYHIGSKLPYELSTALNAFPNTNSANFKSVPLDTQINVQFKKPVNPNAVTNIGGVTNVAIGNSEKVAPKSVDGQITHRFVVTKVDLFIHNGTTWETYNPYEALAAAALNSVNPSDLKLGYWQKKGKEYNNLRVLSNNPLSFTDTMSGTIIPEQLGITAATLFCPSKEIKRHCIQWKTAQQYDANTYTNYENVLFRITKENGSVTAFPNVHQIPKSLAFSNHANVAIIFPEKITSCHIKLFSFVNRLEVSYYAWETIKINDEGIVEVGSPEYRLVEKRIVTASDYLLPIQYDNDNQAIKKIVIEIPCDAEKEKIELQNKIEKLKQLLLEGIKQDEKNQPIARQLRALTQQLKKLENQCCPTFNSDRKLKEIAKETSKIERQLEGIKGKLPKLTAQIEENCGKLTRLQELLASCFQEQLHCAPKTSCEQDPNDEIKDEAYLQYLKMRKEIQLASEKCCKETNAKLERIRKRIEKDILKRETNCEKLTTILNTLQSEERKLNDKLSGLVKQKELLEQYNDVDTCSSYIHEICYLTEEEVIYNHSIPSIAAIEADYSALVDANKVIAPILRPDEKYTLVVETLEKVEGTSHTNKRYFPFATNGPIGHFSLAHLSDALKEQYKLASDGTPPSSSDYDARIELPENNLKFYLDANRCFPNPNGNIVKAKPMYFESPEIQLFFNQPYVKHFFGKWPTYKGLQEKESKLVVVIKDPTENGILNTISIADESAAVLTTLPKTNIEWKQDTHFKASKPLELLNDLRNPKRKNVDFEGQTCWQIGGEPIQPFSVTPKIKVENLLPSKLYNAVVFNDYSKDMVTYERAQIHSYPFQTSRYGSLSEHIGSYHQKNDEGEQKDAIYDALDYQDLQLDASKDLKPLLQMVLGLDEAFPNDIDQTLITTYSDVYQRAIHGYLELKDIASPQATEFNFLRNHSGAIIAIWIRTLEPINDPRIPFEELFDSIKVIYNGTEKSMTKEEPGLFQSSFSAVDTFLDSVLNNPIPFNFATLFSKDRSCALIMPTAPITSIQDLEIKFSYLTWNGNSYTEKQSYTTDKLI